MLNCCKSSALFILLEGLYYRLHLFQSHLLPNHCLVQCLRNTEIMQLYLPTSTWCLLRIPRYKYPPYLRIFLQNLEKESNRQPSALQLRKVVKPWGGCRHHSWVGTCQGPNQQTNKQTNPWTSHNSPQFVQTYGIPCVSDFPSTSIPWAGKGAPALRPFICCVIPEILLSSMSGDPRWFSVLGLVTTHWIWGSYAQNQWHL